MAKPILTIHPGHSLHPGVYTLTSGNQAVAEIGPRLPLLVEGKRVGVIVAQYRCVTTFSGGTGRYLRGNIANHWESGTDTYPVFIDVPNQTGNATSRSVNIYSNNVEPVIFRTMANPGRSLFGGDWFVITFDHGYTAGAFTFDKILLLPAGA